MPFLTWINQLPTLLLICTMGLILGRVLINRQIATLGTRLIYGVLLVLPLGTGFLFGSLDRQSLLISLVRVATYCTGLFLGRHYFFELASLKSFKGSIDLILLLGGVVIVVIISALETLLLLLDRFMPS